MDAAAFPVTLFSGLSYVLCKCPSMFLRVMKLVYTYTHGSALLGCVKTFIVSSISRSVKCGGRASGTRRLLHSGTTGMGRAGSAGPPRLIAADCTPGASARRGRPRPRPRPLAPAHFVAAP